MAKKDLKNTTYRDLLEYPLVRDASLWVMLLILFSVVYFLWPILFPAIVGLILGYLTNPIVIKLNEKYGVNRKLTTWTLVISAIVLLFLLGLGAAPLIVEQFNALIGRLPSYIKVLNEKLQIDLSAISDESIKNALNESVANISGIWTGSGTLFSILKSLVSKTFYFGFVLIMIPIFWFSFASSFEALKTWFDKLIPKSKKGQAYKLLEKMDKAIFGFFRGRLLVTTIMGFMFSFGWWLVDVPYWFLLGMIVGYLNIVPYLSSVGWPLAVLLKYVEYAQDPEYAFSALSIILLPSLVYGIVQFIEGWILTPFIQKDQVDMKVSSILMAVFVGGYVWGVFGMVLAIPFASCFKILMNDYVLIGVRNWAKNH